MADVLDDHGFPDSVRADQDEVAAFADEVESEGALDDVALDLLGPIPVEIGHRFELPEARTFQAPFQAAACAVGDLSTLEFLEDHAGRPASFRGTSDEVIEVACESAQPDAFQLSLEITPRCRR